MCGAAVGGLLFATSFRNNNMLCVPCFLPVRSSCVCNIMFWHDVIVDYCLCGLVLLLSSLGRV